MDDEWDGDRPPGWAGRARFLGDQPRATLAERFPQLDPPAPVFVSNEHRDAETEDWRRAPEPAAVVPRQSTQLRSPKTYLIGLEGSPIVKIGYTGGDPLGRLRGLQTGLPFKLSLLWSVDGDFEADLHARFAAYRVRGEWFDLTPLGESVQTVTDAVEAIKAE
jgi:hypothetical protein